jgi:hypothetical protein
VYDTKYSSKTDISNTNTPTPTTTTTELMRYVWRWVTLGFNGSGGSN